MLYSIGLGGSSLALAPNPHLKSYFINQSSLKKLVRDSAVLPLIYEVTSNVLLTFFGEVPPPPPPPSIRGKIPNENKTFKLIF